MENNFSFSQTPNHSLELVDRKNLTLTGIRNIIGFDAQEFLVETSLGYLLVKGSNLALGKMDTEKGELVIKGIIESISYVSGNKKPMGKEKVVKRIFK